MLTREEELDLTGLRWYWGQQYRIDLSGGTWSASPLSEPATVLTADSADEIRRLLREDHDGRIVVSDATLSERAST